MTVTDVNTTLLVVVILAAAGALAVYLSPKAIVWSTRRMNARARALSAARATYADEWKEAMEVMSDN